MIEMRWQNILKDLSEKDINEHMSKVKNMREKENWWQQEPPMSDEEINNPNGYEGDDGETYFETQLKYRIDRVTGMGVGDSLKRLGFNRSDIISELVNLGEKRHPPSRLYLNEKHRTYSPVFLAFTKKLRKHDEKLRSFAELVKDSDEGKVIEMWNKEIDDLAILSSTILNNKFPSIASAKDWLRENEAYYDVEWNPQVSK